MGVEQKQHDSERPMRRRARGILAVGAVNGERRPLRANPGWVGSRAAVLAVLMSPVKPASVTPAARYRPVQSNSALARQHAGIVEGPRRHVSKAREMRSRDTLGIELSSRHQPRMQTDDLSPIFERAGVENY